MLHVGRDELRRAAARPAGAAVVPALDRTGPSRCHRRIRTGSRHRSAPRSHLAGAGEEHGDEAAHDPAGRGEAGAEADRGEAGNTAGRGQTGNAASRGATSAQGHRRQARGQDRGEGEHESRRESQGWHDRESGAQTDSDWSALAVGPAQCPLVRSRRPPCLRPSLALHADGLRPRTTGPAGR